ncbi:hypothetical protein DXG01_005231 [Tephrocybe rancida]|nr:hypothetical protein DXG01_005231 [Tephrocybe rancida]
MPQVALLMSQMVTGLVKIASWACHTELETAVTENELSLASNAIRSQLKEAQSLSLTVTSLAVTTMSLPKENVLVNEFSLNVLKLTLGLSTMGFLLATALPSMFEGIEPSFRGLGEQPKGWVAAMSTLMRTPKFFVASGLFSYGLAALPIAVSPQSSPLVPIVWSIFAFAAALAVVCHRFTA